jgi:thiosulfate dehydrogenase [quinone] large subunit
MRRAEPGVIPSWKAQPLAIRVLRAFLGATFAYAGIQKLADPNFLHSGTFDYVGAQLHGFAQGSPIGGVIRLFAHVPVLTGVAIALIEIAVGAGTLLGIAPITAAAVGLAINVVLFLSATWHVHPYFLGSDSIYAVAWAAYLVALVDARRKLVHEPVSGHRRRSVRAAEAEIHRREFLRGGVVAVTTLLFAGVARALAGPAQRTSLTTASSAKARPATSPSVSPSTPATPTVQGTPIASLDSIPVGSAIGFTAPGGIGPAVLLRPAQDRVIAFSRVCTHAGCLVGYNPQANLLVCPCHGAEFDPTQNAQPVAGPAFSPLRRIPVTIDTASGQVVATA